MQLQSNQQKIKNIYQMLFEMATGNFTFRLKPTFNNDDLDKMALLLNCIAQEMKNTIVQAGYVSPHFNFQNLVQHIIILDSELVIEGLNSESAKLFGDMGGPKMNFRDILTTQSQEVWDNIAIELEVNENYHSTVHLTFLSPGKRLTPLFCTISRLQFDNLIVISSVTTILQDMTLDKPANTEVKNSDAVVAQQVHDFILSNLEEPLPSTQELAVLFGTNEYNLKESFRHFFKTSIYQFYIDERMKKSLQLIMRTSIPLKQIAYIIGFNSYEVFSKTFKKKFGYTPREIKRHE